LPCRCPLAPRFMTIAPLARLPTTLLLRHRRLPDRDWLSSHSTAHGRNDKPATRKILVSTNCRGHPYRAPPAALPQRWTPE
jgi:hypothetical protein